MGWAMGQWGRIELTFRNYMEKTLRIQSGIQSGTDHDKRKNGKKTPNKSIHTDRLTRPIFGG